MQIYYMIRFRYSENQGFLTFCWISPYCKGQPVDVWSMEDETPPYAMFSLVLPTGGELWPEVEALAPSLNEIGINMVWLPPAYKGASGGYSVGYDTYDL